MTRIFGSGRIGERRFVVVPVGGKALSVAATAFSDEISGFLRSLSSEIRRNPRQGHGLKQDVLGPVQNLFSGGRYLLGASPYLPLMREFKQIFLDRADRSLRHLLDAGELRELPEVHLSGGLLIVPAPADAPMQEEYVLRAARSLGPNFLQALRKRLLAMRLDSDHPEDLRHKAGVVGEAVSRILEGEPEKTQRLTEETARVDRYYAVPVALFAFHEVFEKHFGRPHGTESPAREGLSEQPFRDLLALHAGALFPVEGLLPLGYEYQEFPFVIFNSYSLPELRGKLFAEKQLFASSELNVLNLILTGRQTEPLRQ